MAALPRRRARPLPRRRPVRGAAASRGYGRSLDRPLRIFLAAALPITAWLVLEVATFASAWSSRVQERNMAYVAPLFLIALLAWIDARDAEADSRYCRSPQSWRPALPGALPYGTLISESAKSDTLALMPLWWLQETSSARRRSRRRRGRGGRPRRCLLASRRAGRSRCRSPSRSGSCSRRSGSRLRPRLPPLVRGRAVPGDHDRDAQLGRRQSAGTRTSPSSSPAGPHDIR